MGYFSVAGPMPANLPVGRDLTIRRKIENGRYYCALATRIESRAAWSGDNSISCGRPSRARRSCAPSRPARGIRFPGRLLDVHETPRAEVLAFIAEQVAVPVSELAAYRNRPTNRSEYIAEVGLRLFRRVTLHACMHALTNQRFACKPCV
jgi:hypothetical protein